MSGVAYTSASWDPERTFLGGLGQSAPWSSSKAGRRALGGSCFLRRGEKAPPCLRACRELEGYPSYFQERFFFSSSKDGTGETVTRGICSGLLGPPDLSECMWLLQVQAKHTTETITKEPCKGDFHGHRGRGSLSWRNERRASSG